MNARVAGGFTLGGVVAYNHSRYKTFPGFAANVPDVVGNRVEAVDAAGNPVQRTPKWTTSLTADYQKGLSNGGSLFANVLWSHNDGFAWDPSNFYRQDAYDIVNASLGYAFPNSNIEVRAWVTNLTNDEYERIRFAYTLGRLAIDGAPRMYGLSFTIKN